MRHNDLRNHTVALLCLKKAIEDEQEMAKVPEMRHRSPVTGPFKKLLRTKLGAMRAKYRMKNDEKLDGAEELAERIREGLNENG